MIKHDLISILDLSFEEIESIFSVASLGNEIFTEYKNALEDKVLGSLFFQPSVLTC